MNPPQIGESTSVNASNQEQKEQKTYIPLAEKLRPQQLEDIIGQENVIGKGSTLYDMIKTDNIKSCLILGPPGSGKTTISKMMQKYSKSFFTQIQASTSSFQDLKEEIDKAKRSYKKTYTKTILFVDEIHCLSKTQQEFIVSMLKKKYIILVGTSVVNPSFQLDRQLINCCEIISLSRLENSYIAKILKRGLEMEYPNIQLEPEGIEEIAKNSDGDARTALNSLENIIRLCQNNENSTFITTEDVLKHLHKENYHYDKHGEEHYNIISAFQKSIRGSDEDASIYWFERMILAGEKPEYIARRMLKIANEDIGMADIYATTIATNAHLSVEMLGFPDCKCVLAECVLYLARAKKSNFLEMFAVFGHPKREVRYPVPLPSKLASEHCIGECSRFQKKDPYFLPQEFQKQKLINYDRFFNPIDKSGILPTIPQQEKS